QIRDETQVALTAAERADLQSRHPILAQVLADMDRLETFASGTPPTSPSSVDPSAPSATPLTLAEAQALLAAAKMDLTQLPPGWFARLRQTLFQALREVAS
ncbi:MAG: hypothetical protein J0L84_17950, partial [Verrucomicrobia bacterium]|nr:hypothetical protein [Verrucomicrobiota bacterium]